MPLLSTVVQLSLLAAAAQASTICGRNQAISWSPCALNGTSVPLQCGNLSVPLDYTDKNSNATLSLQLYKISATSSPSKGSILFNFGGPGDDGAQDIVAFAELLPVLTGGYHDTIVFVPRGTGNTLTYSCYSSAIERSVAQLGIVAGNSSDVALGSLWGNTQVIADTCYAAQNETGRLVGTAFVARDMIQIVDALGEDGLLRYWGFSYGTLLGATVVSMFPDRVDKVIFDGVVNPHEYYQNKEIEIFKDTDKVFAGFCSGCVADRTNCPLGRNYTTGAALQDAIYAYISALKYDPVVVPVLGTEALITYSAVKQQILIKLYSPATWASFAVLLDALLAGNTTAAGEYLTEDLSKPGLSEAASEALQGIKCGDVYESSTLAEILPVVEGRHANSKISGDAADHLPMECAQWRLRAKEQYKGNFQVKTRKPVLVIGNSDDPVTPLASARNVSQGLRGSVLLQHGGYGHSSLGQASLCTTQATRAYFVNGTLPKPGTVCKVEVGLFSGTDGYDEVIQYFGTGANSTASKRGLATALVAPKLRRSLFKGL